MPDLTRLIRDWAASAGKDPNLLYAGSGTSLTTRTDLSPIDCSSSAILAQELQRDGLTLYEKQAPAKPKAEQPSGPTPSEVAAAEDEAKKLAAIAAAEADDSAERAKAADAHNAKKEAESAPPTPTPAATERKTFRKRGATK